MLSALPCFSSMHVILTLPVDTMQNSFMENRINIRYAYFAISTIYNPSNDSTYFSHSLSCQTLLWFSGSTCLFLWYAPKTVKNSAHEILVFIETRLIKIEELWSPSHLNKEKKVVLKCQWQQRQPRLAATNETPQSKEEPWRHAKII